MSYWSRDIGMGWDPFSELRGLQREVNGLYGDRVPAQGASRFPLLNMWSSEESLVVTAEVPGIDPKDLEIHVVKNLLTVQGERTFDTPDEGVICHRSERGTGRFNRTLRLPYEVDNEKVSAKYEKGVITIVLPRSEATKPRKVKIATA